MKNGVKKMEEIRGYKAFNSDWTCSPSNKAEKQYTCPGKFEEDIVVDCCNKGMHFCKKLIDCFNYYSFNSETKIAEVIAYGDITENGDKCCTNKLEVVREIPWFEVLELVNTGKDCTGNRNSGNWNSGNRNSGDWNSGDWNSGNWNSGNWNSGNRNSGNCNSGNRNSGNCNSGNWNSGDWNNTNYSNGCFNIAEPKIYLFNKPSQWTYRDWLNSDARYILNQCPSTHLEWICSGNMTEEEKTAHPEHTTTNGFLRTVQGNRQQWWNQLSENNKNKIKSIPNFDADIFKKVTGIEV